MTELFKLYKCVIIERHNSAPILPQINNSIFNLL